MSEITQVSSNKMFGGYQKVFKHQSSELKCEMRFGIYLPAQTEKEKCPALYYLSGLTCTEDNFITKAGGQRYAAEHGIILVTPDTSPRGCNIPGEEDAYDFGSGAGFYVDATQKPWSNNYRMYSYIVKELPELVASNFPVIREKISITGHSMGGHGALICALKNPGLYTSVSAFAPICNPCACPWGQKAFTGYLGAENKEAWKEWDTCELIRSGKKFPMGDLLVDQGTADDFLAKGQLLPDILATTCATAGVKLDLRMQKDYNHSYFFISTFIGDHIAHHAKFLKTLASE